MGGLGLSVIWKKMMDKAKWAQVIEDNEPPPVGKRPRVQTRGRHARQLP